MRERKRTRRKTNAGMLSCVAMPRACTRLDWRLEYCDGWETHSLIHTHAVLVRLGPACRLARACRKGRAGHEWIVDVPYVVPIGRHRRSTTTAKESNPKPAPPLFFSSCLGLLGWACMYLLVVRSNRISCGQARGGTWLSMTHLNEAPGTHRGDRGGGWRMLLMLLCSAPGSRKQNSGGWGSNRP